LDFSKADRRISHAAVYRFKDLGPSGGRKKNARPTPANRSKKTDAMARRFPIAISGIFDMSPLGGPNICFIASANAKPSGTFAGNALSSVAGSSGQT